MILQSRRGLRRLGAKAEALAKARLRARAQGVWTPNFFILNLFSCCSLNASIIFFLLIRRLKAKNPRLHPSFNTKAVPLSTEATRSN